MRLSPLDPLHYAMRATRAFTHLALGEDVHEARWADRVASSPGAHARAQQLAYPRRFLSIVSMQSEAMRVRVLQALARLGF